MITVTCQHCGETRQRFSKSKYCLSCNWAKRHPLAGTASNLVSCAVQRGDLPRVDTLICTDCDKQATDYDHRDYNKPLEVDPVCRGCNGRRGPAHPYIGESS